jgi:transcription elongation factor GreA
MDLEKKIYLTKEGLEKLQREFEALRSLKMNRAEEAPANMPTIDSEFATFQDDLNLLEARIIELEAILKNHELIKPRKKKQIDLGATVVAESDGQKVEFMIVGSLEANPMMGRISNESPVGMALIGKIVGEEVRVQSAVVTIYKIKKIIYNG